MRDCLILSGSHSQIGCQQGKAISPAVRANLAAFWQAASASGRSRGWLLGKAREEESLLPPNLRQEIQGLAEGAGLPYPELLAYNLYRSRFFPEECTVLMAVGSASASGETVFLKNSDKIGGESLVGPNFYKNKEINVLLLLEPKGGNRIIGVAAAGSTGLKMGLNDRGVACGSNIARTRELAQRKVDLTQMRAIDRAQLLREGLEQPSAREAACAVLKRIMVNPMDTPGNVEFADAHEGIIIEGSYSCLAVDMARDDIACRANSFALLKELNDPNDLSSLCRLVRCRQLLEEHCGHITPALMRLFSMDHQNGPGPNSICRHGQHFSEETSLSAAVMELDGREPARSRISLALGKPCHAWREARGNITLSLDTPSARIPRAFTSGEVWKALYTEEAQLG